jgi:archaeal flagellin FlaB
MKAFKKPVDNQKGMTGLETAIILIAFVTVASVFGYSVLSAGLFSAERGKEGIYNALKGAKTNLEIVGSLTAESDNVTYSPLTVIKKLRFSVRNTIAGSPVDMTPNDDQDLRHNRCIITLLTMYDHVENVQWTFNSVGNDNGNTLMETGEQFEILIDIYNLTSTGCPLTRKLQAGDTFTLYVKPALGATIVIQRQLPPGLIPFLDLH